jgi:hypothetical protein
MDGGRSVIEKSTSETRQELGGRRRQVVAGYAPLTPARGRSVLFL